MSKENKRKARKWVATALCVMVALSLIARLHNYRKVVYAYQSLTEDNQNHSRDIATIDKYVGKARVPYDCMAKRPRYIHFWDEYNNFTYNNPVNY